ncbi:MAG TPA: hypothetical protein VGG95_09490 [Edaphobacter sp.]
MNRRSFVGSFAAAVLSSRVMRGKGRGDDSSFTIRDPLGEPIAEDFVGLSYESAQLANPEFFSAKNRQLVRLFRELSPCGNLRIGGGSSEFTTYSDETPSSPPPFEVFGPDTSKTVKHGTVTSVVALKNLRSFLDATNWSCLYGLNLGQGTIENAVREAAAAQKILGRRLVAFQIGNEPDSFRNRYRPGAYTPADYLTEWSRFREAIAKTTPQARFAGPDISNKLIYLTAFAEQAVKYPDVVLLTSHYYAMGPASNPEATLENLLSPEPKLTTLKAKDLPVIAAAQRKTRLPYRMSEGNSCWDGGKAGVSDTFASALWCAGYMLACMKRGWSGVNLHGGGNGFYTPIAGAPSTGMIRRPEFLGIRFAQRFVGARVVDAALHGVDPRIDAFVFEKMGRRELVVINKTAESFECPLPQGMTTSAVLRLHAPAIDSKEGVRISTTHEAVRSVAIAPSYTATAYRLIV